MAKSLLRTSCAALRATPFSRAARVLSRFVCSALRATPFSFSRAACALLTETPSSRASCACSPAAFMPTADGEWWRSCIPSTVSDLSISVSSLGAYKLAAVRARSTGISGSSSSCGFPSLKPLVVGKPPSSDACVKPTLEASAKCSSASSADGWRFNVSCMTLLEYAFSLAAISPTTGLPGSLTGSTITLRAPFSSCPMRYSPAEACLTPGVYWSTSGARCVETVCKAASSVRLTFFRSACVTFSCPVWATVFKLTVAGRNCPMLVFEIALTAFPPL